MVLSGDEDCGISKPNSYFLLHLEALQSQTCLKEECAMNTECP